MEAFTTLVIATTATFAPHAPMITAAARKGPLPSTQPRKLGPHASPKYVMVPFLALDARKGTITYFKRPGCRYRATRALPLALPWAQRDGLGEDGGVKRTNDGTMAFSSPDSLNSSGTSR